MPSEHSPQEQKHTEMVTTLPHHSVFLSCQTQEETEAETCNPKSTNSDSLQLVHLRHQADGRVPALPSQSHSTAWNLRPCLFKEHLHQNCSGKSHQGHATHEHRSTKSYSCNGYKTKIKEKCPYWLFPPTKG